jgi:vancomycin resistance protein YoaR
VDVSGLTPQEVEAALRDRFERFQRQPITLAYGDQVWRPTGYEIGLSIAWDEAVDDAMAVGREGGPFQRWRAASVRNDVLLPVVLDEAILRSYVQGLVRAIDRPPVDAALAVEGQDVRPRPSQTGRSLQVVPSVLEIKQALSRVSDQPVYLVVDTIPPIIDDYAVQSALETTRKMVSGPIILHVDEFTHTLTPEQIGEMLTVERRQDGGQDVLMVMLDQETLRDFVSEISADVRVRPRNAHFRFIDGELQITDEGSPGRELLVGAAVDRINETVLSENREIELNVTEVLPAIRRETIVEMGIKELVGMGESNYGGSSANRTHNIVTAASILDGTLIPPGGVFSFVDAIGAIEEDQGFVQGYSIIGGRTVPNVGGGVCQVSTTVFRAAFFAGVPILERHSHAFRLAHYEAGSVIGMDATIYGETGTDLRFRNDTPGHLLMQVEADNSTGALIVYLYGTKPDREVQLDGPHLSNWVPAPTNPVYVYDPTLPDGVVQQTDWAIDGVDAVVYRHILVDDEIISTDTFYSHFEAWPNVFLIGTGQ